MIPSDGKGIAEGLLVYPFLSADMVRPSVAYAPGLMASVKNVISIGLI